jgi:saccharopine dehydrogenase-like NADP-dependent oxidoreductase
MTSPSRKKVCILGGGRQGRVVASDLAAVADVTVADAAPVHVPGARAVQTDLSDAQSLIRLIARHDLAVGALPARLGFAAARAAVEAGRDFVDVAFYAESAADLDADARRAGVAVIPDCGVAPGLSNLIVGRVLARGLPDEVHIKVGGVAADPSRPYGYVVTWSPDDLLDEYTRPAWILRGGRRVEVPALSGLETVHVDGVGDLEAFFTDGLRTLLSCGVREMTEKTLRWPGHVEQVRPLLDSGTLVQTIRNRCTEGDDLLALVVDVVRGGLRNRVTLVDRPRDGLTAMSRATAFTCAAMARWILAGGVRDKGVVPPERIGADDRAFRFITDTLAEHGLRLTDSTQSRGGAEAQR